MLVHLCPVHDKVGKQKKFVFYFLSPAVALLYVGAQTQLPTVNQWTLIDTPSNKNVGKRLRTGRGVPICGRVNENSFLSLLFLFLFPCARGGVKHQAWPACSLTMLNVPFLFVALPGLLGLDFCCDRTKSVIERAACLDFE